jgi:RNA polymerase sigma factor (sigma-70 family)
VNDPESRPTPAASDESGPGGATASERFERLATATAERTVLFARLRLGPALRARLDAWDVLQDAYVDALGTFSSFRGDDAADFARWMCRIVENRIRALADHFAAAKRRPPAPLVPISRVMDAARASATGASTAIDRRAASERLERAVESLPPDEREVVLLRFFQDRTIDEISDLVGRSPTSVRRLLGNATSRVGETILAVVAARPA